MATANYRIMVKDDKRGQFRSIEGMDEQDNPLFVVNRIYGLVLWGKTSEQLATAREKLAKTYPLLSFRFDKCG